MINLTQAVWNKSSHKYPNGSFIKLELDFYTISFSSVVEVFLLGGAPFSLIKYLL